MLFIDILQSADIDRNILANHALSTVVLILASIEFIAYPDLRMARSS